MEAFIRILLDLFYEERSYRTEAENRATSLEHQLNEERERSIRLYKQLNNNENKAKE